MRDLDLTSLRLFVAVCEERSVSRAAERASIASSAISKRIRALEQQWGTSLLVRRRYGVEPSPAGAVLLEHSRSLLATSQRIDRDMGQQTQRIIGHVRVLASVSMLNESLIDDVGAFLTQPENSGIRIDIEESISPDLAQQIRDGEAALGVIWDAANLRELDVDPYHHDQLAVVVPPTHDLAQRESVTFAETLPWEHVGMPANSIIHGIMARAAAAKGSSLNPRIIMRNHEAVLHAVQAGLAIALVPRGIAHRFARHRTVSVVTLDEPWAYRNFVVCHKPRQWLSTAALALLNFLASAHQSPGDA